MDGGKLVLQALLGCWDLLAVAEVNLLDPAFLGDERKELPHFLILFQYIFFLDSLEGPTRLHFFLDQLDAFLHQADIPSEILHAGDFAMTWDHGRVVREGLKDLVQMKHQRLHAGTGFNENQGKGFR